MIAWWSLIPAFIGGAAFTGLAIWLFFIWLDWIDDDDWSDGI